MGLEKLTHSFSDIGDCLYFWYISSVREARNTNTYHSSWSSNLEGKLKSYSFSGIVSSWEVPKMNFSRSDNM